MIGEKNNRIKYYTGGLLFPFVGLIHAFSHPQSKGFKELLISFFAFIGVAFIIIPEGGILGVNVGSDVAYNAYEFQRVSLLKISYFDYFKSQADANQIDYYLSFITWLVSRFSSNPRVFNGILTLIMGIFLANNVNYVASKSIISRQTKFLIILLLLVPNPAFYSHRWWTALQVFIFGALPFVLDNNYKRGIFAVLSVFIHFSFLYPLVILILFKCLPKKSVMPYLLVFLIFNIIDTLDFSGVLAFSKRFLPELFNQRNEGYIYYELQEHNLLSQSAKIIWKYLNMITSLYVFVRCKAIIQDNKSIRHLFILCLLLGSFSAVTGMTEWGWRFFDLTNFMFCSFYILLLSDNSLGVCFKKYINVVSIFIIYIIFYQIRGILSIIGIKNLFLGNMITVWLWNDNISVLDLIKML